MDPSPVTRSIEGGGRVTASIKRRALISQVCERHERRGRRAHIDLDTLRTAAARTPEVGGRSSIRGEDRGRSLAGAKARRDNRIASNDLKFVPI